MTQTNRLDKKTESTFLLHLSNASHYQGRKNEIMTLAGKWMKLGKKNHPEAGNPDPKRRILYFSLMCGC